MGESFGLTCEDLETIVSTLSRYHQVETALIYGSRAMGRFRRGSDVDIALKGFALDHRTVAEIGYFLNEDTLMPYHFDVLSYYAIDNPNLIGHIDRVGIVFYTQSIPVHTAYNPETA